MKGFGSLSNSSVWEAVALRALVAEAHEDSLLKSVNMNLHPLIFIS
jgi:hypothetical protein